MLDLDNTLYAYDPCHRFALKSAHQFYRTTVAPVSLRYFLDSYAHARKKVHALLQGQAASHSRLLYFQVLLENEAGVSQPAQALKLEQAYWRAFFKKMKLAKWVKPFFTYCRAQRKKIGIVTNLTTAIQMKKLIQFGLARKIDFLVTSEEAGAEKPHPRILRLALQKARVSAHDAVMIGDDEKSDRMAGIDLIRV